MSPIGLGSSALVGWLVGWFLSIFDNYWVLSQTGPKTERLTILGAATHETQLGDHDFCLSRSHYNNIDPTSRERVATEGIEPGTSSPGVARSTTELPRPQPLRRSISMNVKCLSFAFLSLRQLSKIGLN